MIYLKNGFHLKFAKNMIPLWINSTTCSKSFSLKSLEVRAGAPILNPLGFSALLSPGQVFLFKAMLTHSNTRSARAPSIPLGRRSIRIRWFSVPPVNKTKTEKVILSVLCTYIFALVWFSSVSYYCHLVNLRTELI